MIFSFLHDNIIIFPCVKSYLYGRQVCRLVVAQIIALNIMVQTLSLVKRRLVKLSLKNSNGTVGLIVLLSPSDKLVKMPHQIVERA